jgi:hypothetical protein
METGILYVVYNESIRNPDTNERLYKIGITKNSVHDRYYGLGLSMPGKWETFFAYRLEDYAKAEKIIHGILKNYRENGEWFNIGQKELDHIKSTCELMGGVCVTDEVMQEIYNDTGKNFNDNSAGISHQSIIQSPSYSGKPVNPNYPCKVFMFPINNTIEVKDKYLATRSAWRITNKYRDTSEYEYAVGLQHGFSISAYKIKKWLPVPNSIKWEFEKDTDAPEFLNLTWHNQIDIKKGYYGFGNHFVVDFDGKGKFRLIRPNVDQWYDC